MNPLKPFAVLALCSAAWAQPSISLSLSPASVLPGGTATLTLAYQDATPSQNLAALQWNLVLPTGLTNGIFTAGPAFTSNTSLKAITCGPTLICIGAGTASINSNPIGSGVITTVPITVALGSVPGPYAISILPTYGATTAGILATVTTAPVNLIVGSRYDLNGDGLVNGADIAIVRDQANGSAPCGSGDVTGDGKCNIGDVVTEILAVLGIVH